MTSLMPVSNGVPVSNGSPLAVALADELVLASQLLGELAYELANDADTLRRHMASLQKIDLVTQMQLAVSDLLRREGEFGETIGGVTLEDMGARLHKAISTSTAATP